MLLSFSQKGKRVHLILATSLVIQVLICMPMHDCLSVMNGRIRLAIRTEIYRHRWKL